MELQLFVPWLGGLVGLASLFYTIVSNRGKAAEARVTMLETRIALQERLMTEVKGELEHVPGKDSAHRLEMSVARIEGSLLVMDERFKPLASTVERLQEFLLEQAKR
jgi:uncharacterized coiled-coil protein SlyX